MKSEFRFSYLLRTYVFTAILIATLISLTIYVDRHFGFFSSQALVLYVAMIGGVFGFRLIWFDFITIEIRKEEIFFKAPFKKKEKLAIKDIIRTRTFYLKNSKTSNRNGIEVIDGNKTLGLILKDDNEIQIQGSVYSNFVDIEKYVTKLRGQTINLS